jgi:DNA invertase Pin-like site-specific DNA recombinase
MKVALYGRISTSDKGQDVELQLRDLRSYAKARGWVVFDEFKDIGESGSKDRRPEFERLMKDARQRRIDGIVVWRLDRFGRSLKNLITTLDELRELNVAFISLHENLDFSTSTGRLMFHLLAALSQFEKELLKERVMAGIQHARTKGIRIGRRPFFDITNLRTVTDMRDRGMSIRDIAKALKVSKSLVHKTLKILRQETLEIKGSEIRK